jgi:hypothetical protein
MLTDTLFKKITISMASKKKFTVGFTFNTLPDNWKNKKEFYSAFGEWDGPETIKGVANALERSGNRVILFNAYKDDMYDVYQKLDKSKKELDIVFNIAEGFKTSNRESLVPAML